MNEAGTRAEPIDPALKAAGWGVVEGSRIRREYPITLGRIEGHGKRGKALTADYVLEYRNTKLAVVEAKAWDEAVTEGVAQARRIEALQRTCQDCIRERLLPGLRKSISGLLGGNSDWSLEIDPQDSQTLLFHFPRAGGPGLAYITPAVRIELGARSDHWLGGTPPILTSQGWLLLYHGGSSSTSEWRSRSHSHRYRLCRNAAWHCSGRGSFVLAKVNVIARKGIAAATLLQPRGSPARKPERCGLAQMGSIARSISSACERRPRL